MMFCDKCNSINMYGAKYCETCGDKISPDIIKEEYNHTIWGRLQKAENIVSKLNPQNITGNLFFQIISVLVVLAIGFLKIHTYGAEFKIMPHESYAVQYNTEEDEFYLLTDEEEITMNFYIPPAADSLIMNGYDAEGKLSHNKSYTKADLEGENPPKVKKGEYSYVTFEIENNKKLSQKIKVLVLSNT